MFNANDNAIRQVLMENDEEQLLIQIKDLFIIELDSESGEPKRLTVSLSHINLLSLCLSNASESGNQILLKEIVRCLRNCCIKNTEVQNQLPNSTLQQLKLLLLCPNTQMIVKTGILGFFLNFCNQNKQSCEICWNLLEKHLMELLKISELIEKTTALIYYVILWSNNINLKMEMFLSIVKLNEKTEFAIFIIENLIKTGKIDKYYIKLGNVEDRMIVLNILEDFQIKRTPLLLSKNFIIELVDNFKRKSDCILKTVSDYIKSIEPQEVALLAKIIASITSEEEFLLHIQYDRSLLINCAFLLKSIHMAGKEFNNYFTPINKLENLRRNLDNDHPAFGFKANMIRILANLAWKSRSNQDELRELDCLSLIIDCCNVDGKNPYIMQWVIFALKVLCDKNEENQNIILSLTKQSPIDTNILNECGLTLHEDENKSIKLVVKNK